MIRMTQKQLRGLVREVMEGGDDLTDLYDSVSSALEQLLHAESVCPKMPEFQVMFSMIEEARQNIDAVASELSTLVGDPFDA